MYKSYSTLCYVKKNLEYKIISEQEEGGSVQDTIEGRVSSNLVVHLQNVAEILLRVK